MSQEEQLRKKRRTRAGHKGSATRMVAKVDELMAETDPDPTTLPARLTQMKLSLQEKLGDIKKLDEEILDLVEEEDVADEILQSDTYKETIYAAMAKVDQMSEATRMATTLQHELLLTHLITRPR